MAAPGQMAIHGACSRNCWAAFSMVPHEGAGGWTPRPRKDSTASAMIAVGICTVACTTMALMMLGRMCRAITRRSPAPRARAPCT